MNSEYQFLSFHSTYLPTRHIFPNTILLIFILSSYIHAINFVSLSLLCISILLIIIVTILHTFSYYLIFIHRFIIIICIFAHYLFFLFIYFPFDSFLFKIKSHILFVCLFVNQSIEGNRKFLLNNNVK